MSVAPLPAWAKPLHPKTIAFLTLPNGSLREPSYDEWNEDYGLRYQDRKYWEENAQPTPSKSGTPMTIIDFFDPHNIEHLKAYRHLTQTGMWPKGFIPESVSFDRNPTWFVSVVSKMAEEWVRSKLDKEVPVSQFGW